MRLLGRLALIPFRKRSAREIERKRTRERERENSGKQKRIILIECPNYYIIGGGFIRPPPIRLRFPSYEGNRIPMKYIITTANNIYIYIYLFIFAYNYYYFPHSPLSENF